MKERKLLLVGWDAADWEVIDHLISDGQMPTLEKFIKGGARGNIASLSPTLSPMLWTSIATGKRAYDHGITGFVESLPAEDKVIPIRSTSRKCKAVWNELNEAGLKTNVVNWWPSHPAEKVNGAYVSNQFHKKPPKFGDEWPLQSSAIYPQEYQEILEQFRVHPAELTLAHLTPFIPEASKLDPEKDPVLNACLRILAHSSSIHNAATWLMENSEWNFMAVYQEALDHFSHLAMKYHPPRLPKIEPEEFERYSKIVSAAYRFHDMMFERLLELAGPECDVILLSDHGFHSGEGRIDALPDIPAAPALEHRKYGVFAANGPSFKSDNNIYGASLLDITPTILHHFSLPVGEDMEGRVLLDLYKKQEAVSEIPSWETTEARPEFLEDEQEVDTEVLSQLEDLGYVDLPDSDKSEYVRRELLYNRNLSLLEGGRFETVIDEIAKEWNEKHELRFGLLLAQAYQSLQRTEEWETLLEEIITDNPSDGLVLFQLGMLALAKHDAESAIKSFDRIEQAGVRSAQLFNEIAKAFLVQGKSSDAIIYFNKALDIDDDNSRALTGKAQALIDTAENDAALSLLDKSLSLQFFQPQAHYLVSQIAIANKDKDTAVNALNICLGQAPKHTLARKLLMQLEGIQESQVPSVVVVSGWPRSGTSMMMQMLKAGGVPIYSDQKRSADENNKHGYFEHSSVLEIGKNNNWISEARGKAVKVVLPLLRYLPATENYRVIVMHRPLTEVVISQEVMKGSKSEGVMKNFPFQTAVNLQNEEVRLERWFEKQPHISVLHLEMDDCISAPERVVGEIAKFLQQEIDVEKAVQVPKSGSRRIKLGGN